MRIFYAFLVVVTASLLFMLPITTMIYDFRTDIREDTFSVTTAVAQTTANTTLLKAIYGDDTTTISYDSSIAETPVYSSYSTATRQLLTSGLTANTTRSLAVSYDVTALTGFDAVNTLMDRLGFFWLLMIVAFAPAALASMFVGRWW